jgi:ammonia channel protein AmtB
MTAWGVLDFAGGDVVHISSGVSGLAASLVVGKRKAFGQGQELPPHNILLVFMGASLLWVGGWVGGWMGGWVGGWVGVGGCGWVRVCVGGWVAESAYYIVVGRVCRWVDVFIGGWPCNAISHYILLFYIMSVGQFCFNAGSAGCACWLRRVCILAPQGVHVQICTISHHIGGLVLL